MGPFSYLLTQMLKSVETQRPDRIIDQPVKLYRFALMSEDQLNSVKFMNRMNVNGHLSASMDKKYAFDMIKQGEPFEHGQNLVLFEFNLPYGTKHGYCFQMNSPLYSVYPREQEVVLHTGYFFYIDSVKKVFDKGHETVTITLNARTVER